MSVCSENKSTRFRFRWASPAAVLSDSERLGAGPLRRSGWNGRGGQTGKKDSTGRRDAASEKGESGLRSDATLVGGGGGREMVESEEERGRVQGRDSLSGGKRTESAECAGGGGTLSEEIA